MSHSRIFSNCFFLPACGRFYERYPCYWLLVTLWLPEALRSSPCMPSFRKMIGLWGICFKDVLRIWKMIWRLRWLEFALSSSDSLTNRAVQTRWLHFIEKIRINDKYYWLIWYVLYNLEDNHRINLLSIYSYCLNFS